MQLPGRLTTLQSGEVIAVALHLRRIDFRREDAPEMVLSRSETVGECADAGALLRLLERLPAARTGGFAWWALDRDEACALCARRLDTARLHWALAVTIQAAAAQGAGLVACWYPERYCVHCQPPGQPATAWPARH